MRRRIALVVAAVCGVGAVLLAVLPYTGSSEFKVPDATNQAPDADGNFLNLYRINVVEGRCQPPVVSAWRKARPDGPLPWTVTVGTNMEGGRGYASVGSLGRWCADSARHRLLASLGLGVLGMGAVLIGRRDQPPSATQTGPAPA
jgi:hypothetical protein